jgi:hypothetical protein
MKSRHRPLSDFEEQVILKWKFAAPELWSRQDLYSLDIEKIINGVKAEGLSFLGFDKDKLFQHCLTMMKRREEVENIQVLHASKILSLIEKSGGKISHYSPRKNIVSTYEITLQDYYGNHFQDSFTKNLREALGGKIFSGSENKLHEKIRVGGEVWFTSNSDFKDLQVYPEVEEYLKHTDIFTSLRIEIAKLAETLPALFQIPKDEERLLALKPCFLNNGIDGFYLTCHSSHYNIIPSYEGFTTWKI